MKKSEKDSLVHKVVEEIYADHPFLWEKFGQNGVDRTEEDNYHHLDHLESAYEMQSAAFFLDYTEWLNNVLTSRNVGTDLIVDNFQRLIRLLSEADIENEKERLVYIDYLKQATSYLYTLSE
ncbi:hypothetical protein EQV77_12425 [Halobacillus fulvus]|nr:hypothetical protein EQV77_12425 [Halobacillus fulvus]